MKAIATDLAYRYAPEHEHGTGLAERVAHELDHDEWLDDETHWIWEIAMEALDAQ